MEKNIGKAKFVKEAREERAWSQSQLAVIAGVDLRTIQRLEKSGTASLETLMGVAAAFDIDVKELNQISTQEKSVSQASKTHLLNRIASGKNLADIIAGADQFQVEHDDFSVDPRMIGSMKDILKLLNGDVVRLYDANPVKKLDVEAEMTSEIQGLESYGFYLFGIKRIVPVEDQKSEIVMCTLYLSHANSPRINKKLMTIPAKLTEVAKGQENG